MKNKFRLIIKVASFLTLFCLIFAYASAVLYPKWGNRDYTQSSVPTFYLQPKNSIDVLFIGSSSFLRGISSLIMWEKYGFPGYTRASAQQSAMINYYYLKEALKYQHPKVVVIDGISIVEQYNVDAKEPYLRKAVDPMKWSVDKIQLIMDILSRSKNQTLISYLFPLFRFHSRWNEVTPTDFVNFRTDIYDSQKGSNVSYNVAPQEFPEHFMRTTNKVAKYSETSLDYMEKTVQLCRENNIAVIFVTLPRFSWKYSNYLAIKQFADQHNIPYIDYTLPENFEALGIDKDNDFADLNHLNIYGTQKISINLGSYLQQRFGFSDKRKDPAYKQWNIDLQVFNRQFSQAQSLASGK
jgi:hypothetical protein